MKKLTIALMLLALGGPALAAPAPALDVEVLSPGGQSHRYSDMDRHWLDSIEKFAKGPVNGTMTVKFSGKNSPQPWVITKKGDVFHNNIGKGVRPDGNSKALIEDLHKYFTLVPVKSEVKVSNPH